MDNVPHKAHVQKGLIDFFCGNALFTAGKTRKPTIMCTSYISYVCVNTIIKQILEIVEWVLFILLSLYTKYREHSETLNEHCNYENLTETE